MKTKLLAIVGSQRRDGNSYLLAKAVFEAVEADAHIVQLADEDIGFCNVCEECVDNDCVLDDDFNRVLAEMRKADGIIFVVPKYLVVPSKFLAFLERLATIVHMRRHMGYAGEVKNPDFRLFSGKKPFGVFALSGTGRFGKENLRTVVGYIGYSGLTLVRHDRHPFMAVNIKAGDDKGEVLRNKAAVKQCKELTQKVIASAKRR